MAAEVAIENRDSTGRNKTINHGSIMGVAVSDPLTRLGVIRWAMQPLVT